VDYYQVLAGFRRKLPERLVHALIGPAGDGRIGYDALHDVDLTKPLLEGFARQSSIGGIGLFTIPGARFSTGLDSLVLTTEQTNTSLVYGDESILKVFRRLSPGPNPDLEVTTALAALGSPHVAEPLAWAEARLEGAPTVLAIMSRYLRLASDGWSLAATSVRDLYALAESGISHAVHAYDAGGDFAGESRRLGAATARVHADLATAFGTDELPTRAIGELTEQMFRKLDLTVSAVPELAKYADMIGQAYSELARIKGPLPVQRVHGDYHLGQVLRTQSGWVVLDFEGEPATPLAQRRARSSPLRDVAGMLRSFDYAARHQLIGNPDAETLSGKARDWARRNATAFCAGYAEAGGLDPAANEILLRALQLDKAVYEVLYEARHRPSWLPIPLESLADF
jgi:maltokinase